MISSLAAHLVCLALVAADFTVRTWRTQLFLRPLGYRLPFREVLVQGAIGETASSLTPLRAGGEPARVWALGQEGVPARVAVVAVGAELVATSVVIALTALALIVTVGADWWAAAGPGLAHSASRSWPWLAGIGAATLLAWVVVQRVRPDLLHAVRDELAATRGHLRDLPLWVYGAQVPLTLLQIAVRVAILPVLAQVLDQPPPLAATVMGSFALLHAQSVLPTPAGAGAVEVGFLGGAVGNLGAAEAALLVAWRAYTTVFGIVLGVVLAAWRFHANVLSFILRRPARLVAAEPEAPAAAPAGAGAAAPGAEDDVAAGR